MHFRIIRVLILVLSLGLLAVNALAQGVRAVVVNDNANIRVSPALGAEVIGTVAAGYTFEGVSARSGDNEWIRVDYFGEEGWVNLTPLTVLDGNVAALPVADPRTIPYGGFESPRAGSTDQQGGVAAKATDGLRVRAGPGRAYPTLANINYNQLMTLTGRTSTGRWYQVSFEGVLGWVSGQFVQILSGDVSTLPVDGIVAKAPPLSGEGTDEYFATLRLMRDRLNIAQGSLNAIRAAWTDSSLTGRAQCNPYPARPSDINIAVPLLAAHYNELNPLQTDFNTAMFNLRKAIDLFIEVCNLPGTGNPVGVATVQGALDVVNLTEAQFASLRDRLSRLIPPDDAGPNQCILTYNNKTEILPVISVGTIYLDEFTRRNYSTGYCFDGVQGQIITGQALPLPKSTIAMFMSISALDDPRTFLGVNQVGEGIYVSLGPITLPRTTRYLVILADITAGDRGATPQGKFAVRIANVVSTSVVLNLKYDETTGSVILSPDVPGAVVSQPTNNGAGGTTGTNGDIQTTAVPATTVCPSTAFNCNQLFTCEEARSCLSAGNFSLDADNDGIPCEETLCQGQ